MSIELDPFVHADIATIGSTIADMIAVGVSHASCVQVLELTASTLEAEGLLARLGGRVHLYGTSISVADAMQRVQELRALAIG